MASTSAKEVIEPTGRAMKTRRKRSRLREGGQAIVESVICMLLICLILFGLLQLFYLSVAQMFADYSSFCAARSRSVGFADYLVNRSARVASIGASGQILYPENDRNYGGPLSQFAVERVRIPEYIQGDRYLFYGIGDANDPEWSWNDLSVNASDSMGMIDMRISYRNYPLNFPMRAAFTGTEEVDIHGDSRVLDHSNEYLE